MNISQRMVIVLTVISMLSGGILSTWDIYTKPKIEQHRFVSLQNALKEVLPDYDNYEKIVAGEITLYLAYKINNEQPVGIAFEAVGNGFQGIINVMVAVTPDLDSIIKIKILEQLETPGLGTRIVEDPTNKKDPSWFTNQFKNKLTYPRIEVIKNAIPGSPNEVQAITGATISSKAIVTIINNTILKAKRIYQQKRKNIR
jgi:electron transport complex protein RnfG